ncbi:MAG: hypothetical protein HY645_15615 [Acidobacteria bacterium]|nr:hypothetical protein [Acidobacteriota bacterium]
MPRTSRYIIIEGQYASGVLGTFRIIRGFATLQELAMISAPFPMNLTAAAGQPLMGHQREINPQHAESIKRYLQDGRPRFIPEIILSIRAEYRDELDAQQKALGVISDSTPGLLIHRRFRSRNIATHQIILEKDRLPAIVEIEHRIRRIDGNHRLHLASQLQFDSRSPTKYLAPFCAILLGPPGDANDDFDESMLFHTINSLALPLDSEHALQLVLGQAAQYRPSADEEFAANPSLYLTRLMKERMDVMPPAQRERLGDTPATVLNLAANAMVTQDAALSENRQTMATFADGLSGALTDILARLPAAYPELCRADFFIELASLAWGETDQTAAYNARIDQAVATLEAMGRWVGKDGLHNIRSRRSIAQQLFEIYRTVRARIPKRVFLSRWYPTDDDGNEKTKADLRKQGIERALDDLRAEEIDLALDDPGTQTGGTFAIHQEMYNALARNDIILVDLSGVRPNVCIEAGYALKHYERGRLIIMFQVTEATPNNPKWEKPPFDVITFRYEQIGDTGEIPGKLKPHFRAIWQEAIAGKA